MRIDLRGPPKRPDWDRPKEHMRHIAPIAHAHINLKGTLTFNLEQHKNPGQNEVIGPQHALNARQ